MGFVSGFVSFIIAPIQICVRVGHITDIEQFTGFSLTTTLLYLTIQVHHSNRIDQRNAIRQQVELLNNLASPTGAYDRRLAPKDHRPHLEAATEPSQPPMKDMLKHRWNKEMETLARKVYEGRWEDVRDTAVEGWKAAKRLVKGE